MLRKSRSISISVNPQLWPDERLAAGFDVALEVAILLLKMLRLEEQPLGPDDFVIDRHSRQLRIGYR